MNSKRVLVVDDSKVARLTLKKKLEVHGVVVDLAESAQQALDYLAQNRPDIIFMDHLMPDMDGFEATRRIKSAPATQDIPIIICSGRDDEAYVEEARSIGAINAIGKPPAAGVLEAILSSIPETVTGPAPSAVGEAAPQPVAVERRAAPFMDQSAVHALVERVLGEFVEHLHSDILAELKTQVEAEFENERKAQQEWSGRWREQLDETAAGMADLRSGALDAETLRQQLNAIEQRLLPLESEAVRAAPDLDAVLETVEQHVAPVLADLQARIEHQEPLLESLRQELLVRAGDQHAQVEQSVGELASRLDALSEDMKQLSDGTLSSEAGHDQRFEVLEKRLVAIESVEHTPGLDLETMLAAMDARIAPRLAEMQIGLQTQLEGQSPIPLEEALRESLSGQLQEQHEALRSELEAQRTQVQAISMMRDALEAELAAQGERLQAQIEEERERLMTRYEQERTQLAASLEEQQTRLGACDDGWTHRFQALEERLEEMAQVGIDDGVQRVLEQRIVQMREVISAAMQPGYPGRGAWAAEVPRELTVIEHEAPVVRAPAADEGGGLLKAIEAKISDLREQLSETRLHRLIADAVGSARPATEADPGLEERMATRLADRWNDRLRAEVVQLEGKVKTLTAMIAVGGVALLAVIAAVALLR